ncbi:MAG TPA: NAD(P)H-binding protein [Candidatus Limnocylindria bacterium]|nr:NAD(P)H-binding protein [Candidatus Limnocylindria bacterium]
MTGAFGFSGRHIARLVLERGEVVINLTNHPSRPDPFSGRVRCAPLTFDDPDGLAASLAGVDTLFNTYWVRFARGAVTHEVAAQRSATLFRAARKAGVRRVVHVSIANAEARSDLPYYRGKARVEDELRSSGLSHAIIRPAVLVGDEPILTNTIAWLLRRFPTFTIPGDGRYGIAPIHVEDLAELAVSAADESSDLTMDAVGPETFTFCEYVAAVRAAVGARARLVKVPQPLALLAAQALGVALRDTILTRDEMTALTAGLLVSRDPPRGTRRVSDWLRSAGPWLGRCYLPEVARHFATATPAAR